MTFKINTLSARRPQRKRATRERSKNGHAHLFIGVMFKGQLKIISFV